MSNNSGKPMEPPLKDGYCQICQKVETDKPVCDTCYADGWRVGSEMIEAIRSDPEFMVDDQGKVTIVPDYRKKWGINERT